jgi:hypothetical protein
MPPLCLDIDVVMENNGLEHEEPREVEPHTATAGRMRAQL